MCFWQEQGKRNNFNMPEDSVLLDKACPQGKLFYQSPEYLGKRNAQLQIPPTSHVGEGIYASPDSSGYSILLKRGKKGLISTSEIHSPGAQTHQKTEMRPNHRIIECFPLLHTVPLYY